MGTWSEGRILTRKDVILICAQRQSKGHRALNEQSWLGQCAEALQANRVIASSLEQTHQRRSNKDFVQYFTRTVHIEVAI